MWLDFIYDNELNDFIIIVFTCSWKSWRDSYHCSCCRRGAGYLWFKHIQRAVTAARTCSSPSSFLGKVSCWRWWKATTRCGRFDKASSAASIDAILRWSPHTKLVSPSHRWPPQLLPMPTKVSWRCELWSWQETAHTSDCCKTSYGHPTLSPCRHILDILAVSMECAMGLRCCRHPSIPFPIFKTRFSHSPIIIIYNNACCLHVSCLNRVSLFWEHSICCRPFSLVWPHRLRTLKATLWMPTIRNELMGSFPSKWAGKFGPSKDTRSTCIHERWELWNSLLTLLSSQRAWTKTLGYMLCTCNVCCCLVVFHFGMT